MAFKLTNLDTLDNLYSLGQSDQIQGRTCVFLCQWREAHFRRHLQVVNWWRDGFQVDKFGHAYEFAFFKPQRLDFGENVHIFVSMEGSLYAGFRGARGSCELVEGWLSS